MTWPDLDLFVPPGGYAWWYVDALSDDGRHGLTIIAFVGSVFSPYYAWARRRAADNQADPLQHCTLNVSLYGSSGKRWAMTERGGKCVARTGSSLTIGPSSLSWNGSSLVIDIDEITAPLPSRIRGRVRLAPAALTDHTVFLDKDAHHRWRPIAPCSRVEVAMDYPGLSWSGNGYLDSNNGDVPLESSFSGWHWARANLAQGAAVTYDVTQRNGQTFAFGRRFDSAGRAHSFTPPPATALPSSAWGIDRRARADTGAGARLVRTLEDGPFYARSVLSTRLLEESVTAIHESLSLERFATGWVRMLLPFRMPRSLRSCRAQDQRRADG